MGALDNPRHEALAQGLARGISVREATIEAGLSARHLPRSVRLAASPAVVARMAEIRQQAVWGGLEDLEKVFGELMRLAEAAGKLGSAAGMNSARTLLAEAARLRERLPAAPATAEAPLPPRLSKEEWIAAFAPVQ